MTVLEHVNYSVTDAAKTADWMGRVFGWKIRWKGAAIDKGYTIHIGTDDHYIALYTPTEIGRSPISNYNQVGGLNHIAVVVDDLDPIEQRVREEGFRMGPHYDYEPGERFYFFDHDHIEYEVVCYA